MGLYFPHFNVEVYVSNSGMDLHYLKLYNDHLEEQIQNFNEAHHPAIDIHVRSKAPRTQCKRRKKELT